MNFLDLIAPGLGKGFNDSEKTKAFDEIKRRWSVLLGWGFETKVPEGHAQIAEQRRLSEKWDSFLDDHEAADLQGAAVNLSTAEGLAQRHGYSSPDVRALTAAEQGPKGAAPPVPVRTPAPEKDHPIATAIDQAAPNLPGAPRTGEGPAPAPDPYLGVKVAGVGALALGTVAGTLATRGDAARVGVAVLGTLATAAAGWMAFAPGKKERGP